MSMQLSQTAEGGCRREADRVSLLAQLQAEQSEHAAARQQHAAGMQELQIQIGNLKVRCPQPMTETLPQA